MGLGTEMKARIRGVQVPTHAAIRVHIWLGVGSQSAPAYWQLECVCLQRNSLSAAEDLSLAVITTRTQHKLAMVVAPPSYIKRQSPWSKWSPGGNGHGRGSHPQKWCLWIIFGARVLVGIIMITSMIGLICNESNAWRKPYSSAKMLRMYS